MVSAVGVATCRIGDLITSPEAALLAVKPSRPDSLKQSSPLGSTAPVFAPIQITNDGGGELKWSAIIKHASPWAKVDPDTGTAGQTPTAQAVFDPTDLPIGVYEDTVVVSAVSGTGTFEVPLWYQIRSCDETTLAVPDSDSTILTSADCGAPHRRGRFARIYRINNVTANDSLTIDVTAAYDAYVAFDTSLAANAPPFSQSDNCLGAGSDPCLYYQKAPRNGTYFVEVTSADSADTGAFKVRVLLPRSPNAPDSLDQRLATDSTTPVVAGGQISQTSIVLRAIASDPDLGDTVHLEAEVRPVGTSFTGPTSVGGAVPNGSPAYVVASGLSDNTSYNWRLRVVDQTGRPGGWQVFSANPAFNVQSGHDPTFANSNQYQSDGTTLIAVGGNANTPTVNFKAQLSDIDPGNQLTLQVEVKDVGTGFDSVNISGASTPVASGSIATAPVSAPTLVAGHDYHWQARVVDNTGRHSGWASFGGNAETAVDFHVNAAATQLNWLTQPSATATAGSPIGGPPKVAVQDQNNQTVTTFNGPITMRISTHPSGGQVQLLGDTTVNAVNGVATFPNLIVDTAGVGYKLLATTGTINTAVESSPFTVTAAAVTQLVFTVQPSSATAGVAIALPIKVSGEDQFGNVNTSFTGSVAMAIAANPGSGTLGGTTPVSAVSGVATFSNLSINKVGNGYTLRASSGPLMPDTSVAFNITPASATHLVYAVQPTTALAGNPITPAIKVAAHDQFENLATAFTGNVTLTITPNTGTSGAMLTGGGPLAASSGVATFANATIDKIGTKYTLTASAGGLGTVESDSFDISNTQISPTLSSVSASPSTITASTGSSQTTITVIARDLANNTVANASVSLIITGSGNTQTPTGSRLTNGSGVATFTLSSTVAETKTVTAVVNGFTISTQPTVTVSPAALASWTFTNQPSNTTAGAAINSGSGGVVVTGNDQFGNKANFAGTVTMTLGAGPVGGSLSGTTTATAAAGVATFNGLQITKAGAGYQLQASGGSVTSPLSNAFTIVPAAPNKLVFTTQPAQTAVLAKIDSAQGGVVVTVQDAFGNTTPFGGTVRITIGTDGAGGGTTLTGGNAISAPSGVAVFPNLTLNQLGTGFTLLASTTTGGVGGDESTPFDIVTGPPAKLAIMTQPASSAQNGTAFAQQPVIQVQDAHNFPVSQSGIGVTAAIATGPAGTLSNNTATTKASGAASFSGLTITGATGSYTLSFSSPTNPTLTPATSNSITLSAGTVSASQSTVSASPASIPASSGSSTSTITVTAKDQSGNPIQGATVVLAATGTGNTLTPPAGTTNSSGVATGTLSSTVAAAKTISAAINGVAITQTATVTVTASTPSASLSTVSAAPTSIPASTGANKSTITVTARDQFGNLIQGATVVLAATGTGNTVTQPAGPTDASGVATGTLSSTVIGDKVVSATIAGVGITQTATVTVTPGTVSAGNSTVAASPTTIPASSGTSTTTITVTAKDGSNNVIPGASVTIAVSGTGNTLTPASLTATADGNGQASWTLSSTVAETKTISAIINTVAITQTATVTVTAGAVSAAQSMVSASPTTIAASTGSSQSTITVTAKDQFGNPIQGATVVLGATGTGNTLTQPAGTTNASGVATGALSSTVAEPKTVSATINGTTVTQTATVTVTAGTVSAANSTVSASPTTITASSGSSTTTITVTAKDGSNNVIPGASVTLAVSGTSNTLTPASLTATANGSGVATWTLSSTAAQAKTISATINGTAITQTATVTVTAGAVSASQSTVSASPTTIAASNGSSQSTITVTAKDQFGNPIQGATVVLAATGTGNTLTQPAATTNASGVATGTLSSTVAELKTVSALINGTGITQTAGVTVTVGTVSAANSTVSAAPTTITASSGSSTTTITVTAKDGSNNVVAGASVTLAVSGTGNTLTPASLTATTNGSGQASWTLSSTAAEAKIVSATINSVSITQTATVTVNPGAVSAANSTVSASPTPITASSGTSTSTITVTAKDGFNNVIPGASVTIAVSGTGNALTPASLTATANGSGVATWTLSSTVAETKTVSATINSVSITQTAPVTVAPATATTLAFTTQPQTSTSGSTMAPIVLTAFDAFGNVATSFTGNVTLAITNGTPTTGGPGALSGTTTIAASAGVATFGDLSITGAGTGYTLDATSSLPTATSTAFDIN